MSPAPEIPNISPPPGALQLARQMNEQRIELLTQRTEALKKENELLKAKVEKSERDQHDFVSYFQKELEMKDAVLAELKEEAAKKDQETRNDLRVKCAAYEATLATVKERSQEVENALRIRVKILEEDIKMLNTYREHKANVEAKIAELTKENQFLQERRKTEVADVERKFLMDKALLQERLERQREQIILEARAEAENGLHAKTRQIWLDNKRFAEEMKFQTQMVSEMGAEKEKAEAENVRCRREVELSREKEKEYLQQIRQKTQAIHSLNKRLDELEQAQTEAQRRATDERTKLRSKLKKASEDSMTDLEGMKTMIKVKNKELRHIKKLAQVVVDQRSEVEQFFLDTLDEVKAQIRREREQKYRQELDEHNNKMQEAVRGGQSFPRIRGRLSVKNFDTYTPAPSRLPVTMYEKVELRKLTWEDREKVLRMLFAKINAVQAGGINPMPSHPLDTRAPAGMVDMTDQVEPSAMAARKKTTTPA